jgi:hypothetical protein
MAVTGRYLLVTVDFEAFQPEHVNTWCMAMEHWAERAKRAGLRFCFFIAVENVARLRAQAPDRYRRFITCLHRLQDGGSAFYPHNHYVFDPDTGARPVSPHAASTPPPTYTKRASMYWDVVYRHRLHLAGWLKVVRATYDVLLRDADLMQPNVLAFRAGGWDYGSSSADLANYIDSLAAAGVQIDSSACSGAFGTASWRMGSWFGSNMFRLAPGLIEVAPCSSLDASRSAARCAARSVYDFVAHGVWPLTSANGAFVLVIHFDHLFHELRRGTYRHFCVADSATLGARIDRLFAQLTFWRSALSLTSVSFDDLGEVIQ